MVQMILWGFITKHFMQHSDWLSQAAGVLIAGVLLWDVMFRSQLGFSVSFLEEMWSRNLGQLFVSPLRPMEMVLSLMLASFIRTIISIIPAAFLAIPLYAFSIYDMGFVLIAFFSCLLISGWVLGLYIISGIIKFGVAAESLAWLVIFVLAPISAVYYPVETLPTWLQKISLALPQTHIFEGMRLVLFENRIDLEMLLYSFMLNILYFAIGLLIFLKAFQGARKRGSLINVGE